MVEVLHAADLLPLDPNGEQRHGRVGTGQWDGGSLLTALPLRPE